MERGRSGKVLVKTEQVGKEMGVLVGWENMDCISKRRKSLQWRWSFVRAGRVGFRPNQQGGDESIREE